MSDSRRRERLDHGPWVWDWFRERVVASWYLLVPLALLITLAGGTGNPFARGLSALLGIVVLRLWDDVEDLPHDRRHYPARVLCRLPSSKRPRGLVYLGLLATCVSALMLGDNFAPLAVLLVLETVAFEVRSAWPRLRGLFTHVILLKVPALVLAFAIPAMPMRVVLGRALMLYGVACAYELLHDAEARRSPHAAALAFADIACICAGLAIWLLYPRMFP